MKKLHYLFTLVAFLAMAFTGARVQAQEPECGNIIHYDSTWSWSLKHHDFPGTFEGHPLEHLDSIFGQLFNSTGRLFEDNPFAFGPFSEFIDSLGFDFFMDSSMNHDPFGIRPFEDFPDSLFPDAFMPFQPRPFNGPEGFFEKHEEWLERFHEEFPFTGDSLHKFQPKWQQLPQLQKKSAQEIEI